VDEWIRVELKKIGFNFFQTVLHLLHRDFISWKKDWASLEITIENNEKKESSRNSKTKTKAQFIRF
jgi:hypothetical protein